MTARESQRQINNDVANGNVTERRWSRPTTPAVIDKEALDKEMMLLKSTVVSMQRPTKLSATKTIS